MQHLVGIFFILLQLTDMSRAGDETPQPYCYYNKTETSYNTITKTRLKQVAKKGIFGKFGKKETQIETYEDQEPVHKIKLERSCCEGYKPSELELCEPQCNKNGCPPFSKCVEPEVCECLKGYLRARSIHNGKNYCDPICEKACPEYSVCVGPNECACIKGYHKDEHNQCQPFCDSGCPYKPFCMSPNKCECQEGFKAEQGFCVPTCDQCQNGKCVAKDTCVCYHDYKWNSISNIRVCKPNSFEAEQSSTASFTELTESVKQTSILPELETDIETSRQDIDPNEVFDEIFEYTTSTHRPKCKDDYVYHQGECKPLKFASNEIDCWLKPCQDEYAKCLENGTCACLEGFKLFKTHVVDNNSLIYTSKAKCLPVSENEDRLLNLTIAIAERTQIPKWSLIFFIVLGVLLMVSALIFLGLKLMRSQTGEMDVEDKTLTCAYAKRPCVDSEKSIT